MEKILDRIETSHDVKKLDDEELGQLCRELREEIISTVSKTGGHLASNLGVVELTAACTMFSTFQGTNLCGMLGIRAMSTSF